MAPVTEQRPSLLDGSLGLLEHVALVVLDKDWSIREANEAYCDLVGRPQRELVGRTPLHHTHPSDHDLSRELLERVWRDEGALMLEKRLVRPDGETVWVRVRATKVHCPGVGDTVVELIDDITDLQAARTSDRLAHRRLASLVQHAAEVIAVVDPGSLLIDANPALERILGWDVASVLGSPMLDLIHPEDRERVTKELERVLRLGGLSPPVRFRAATPSGRWVALEATANNRLEDPGVRGVVVNAHDMTAATALEGRLHATFEGALLALVRATEFRDPYTAGHQQQVAVLSRAIGVCLGVPEQLLDGLRMCGLLHDVGKIALPAEIMTRPGKLSVAEMEIVKTHCQVGSDILSGIDFPWPVADVALHHHERLDGSGYPHGLVGDAIGFEARVVAVADVVDAMSSHRPYRPSLGFGAARAELAQHRGTRYDADVVDAALHVVRAES